MVDFWVAFPEMIIIVRRLIREGSGDATAGKVILPDSHDLSAQALGCLMRTLSRGTVIALPHSHPNGLPFVSTSFFSVRLM